MSSGLLRPFIQRWFAPAWGERTASLVRGLSWMVPAAFLAKFLTGIVSLLTARYLGPANFGQANLAMASSLWIQVPLFAGIPTALMYFLPQEPKERRKSLMTAALSLLLLFAATTFVLGYGLAPVWASWQGLTVPVFLWGLLWCAGNFVFVVGTTIASAYERFRMRSALELSFAIGLVVLTAAVYKIGSLNAFTYLLCMALAYAATGLVGCAARFESPVFNADTVVGSRRLLTYGMIASVGGVVNALLYSSARLVANRHLSLDEVGILSAYQAGSIQMASFLLSAVIQVFFPLASRTPNKKVLLDKITGTIVRGSLPALIIFAAFLSLYVLVLGRRYPFELGWVIIYSLAALTSLVYGILTWFLAALGRRGLLLSSLMGLVTGIANYGLCVMLIPRWTIQGAGLASVAAALFGTIVSVIAGKWFLSRSAGQESE